MAQSQFYEKIVHGLEALAGVLGGDPTPETLALSAKAIASELTPEQFERACVLAIKQCKFFPRPAEIIALGAGDDSRPGVEVAWAMCPSKEELSVVWTEEMAESFGLCRSLLTDGDPIAARMVFKEHYQKMIVIARAERRPVRWIVSLGWEKSDRVRVLSDAVQNGRLKVDFAYGLLSPEQKDEFAMQLPAPVRKLLIGDSKPNPEQVDVVNKLLAEMRERKLLAAPKDEAPELTVEEWRRRKLEAKAQAAAFILQRNQRNKEVKSAKRTRKKS